MWLRRDFLPSATEYLLVLVVGFQCTQDDDCLGRPRFVLTHANMHACPPSLSYIWAKKTACV